MNLRSGGSKTPWTAAPELSEAPSARWSGQYSTYGKETISLIAAVPHGQRCGPVRAYGRLAPSFPGRRIQGALRTTAPRHPMSILPCSSHLKLSGASRGLPFAAGKNSAPRARRPQPRRNAGQSAGAGSKCPFVDQGRVRLRPTRPNRLRQLAVVKTQPPGLPCKSFNRLKGRRRQHFYPGGYSNSPPGGSKPPWTAAPELSEAPSARWPGQYSAYAKGTISIIEAGPHRQSCCPVRAYGRLAPSFPERRIQGALRTTATKPPKRLLSFSAT